MHARSGGRSRHIHFQLCVNMHIPLETESDVHLGEKRQEYKSDIPSCYRRETFSLPGKRTRL